MKIIIGFRKSAPKGGKVEQFEMVRTGTGNPTIIKNKILRSIETNCAGNYDGTDEPVYDFYINDEGKKRVANSIELSGETVGVTDEKTLIEFTKDESGDIKIKRVEVTNENLPQQSTVNQLKKLRKSTKGVTIDDKISDMNKQGANIQYIRNPIDSGIESYQDYQSNNKNLDSKHVFKRIKPFKNYQLPQPTSHKKKKAKKEDK